MVVDVSRPDSPEKLGAPMTLDELECFQHRFGVVATLADCVVAIDGKVICTVDVGDPATPRVLSTMEQVGPGI
jgi:hypothetical protein